MHRASIVSMFLVTVALVAAQARAQIGRVGDLYVTSLGTNSVIEFNPATGLAVGTFATGPLSPRGLAFHNGNLFVSNVGASQVLEFTGTSGAPIGAYATGGLDEANNMLFTSDGRLLVSNVPSHPQESAVMQFDGNGNYLGIFASQNMFDPQEILPFTGNTVLVANDGTYANVLQLNLSDGSLVRQFITSGSGGLVDPTGMTFGPNGDLFVSSYSTNQVLEYNGSTGDFVKVFASGNGLSGPRGLLFAPNGDLYVTSYNSNSIISYDGTTGAYVSTLSGGGLQLPVDIALKPVPEPAGAAVLLPLVLGSLLRRRARGGIDVDGRRGFADRSEA